MFLILCSASVVPESVVSGSNVRLVDENWVYLHITPLAVDGDDTATNRATTLAIPPTGPGRQEFRVSWPGQTGDVKVTLSGTLLKSIPGEEHRVALESSMPAAGGGSEKARREVALRENTTSFVEIYASGRRHLTLAVRAESVRRPALAKPVAGMPVRLHLEVERLLDGRGVPLETNDLDTLVGEAVEYFFRRGEAESLEQLRLVLRPVTVDGGVIRIEASLSGSLMTLGAPLFLDRSEVLVTTRNATSAFVAAEGDPPNGYRFLITPIF